MIKKLSQYLCVIFIFFPGSLISGENGEYKCGIAVGFPPYQYVNGDGKTAGLDYEIARIVFAEAGLKVRFIQDRWDDVMFNLAHRTGKVDLLCGAERASLRDDLFDFSDSYYRRHIALFVLSGSDVKKVSDLYGRIITGDRHSFFEEHLGENKKRIRVMQTPSKEDSFIMLKEGGVEAVIAPIEVALFLSRKLNISVRTVGKRDPGSPVAFAVAKGDRELLAKINYSLRKLKREGKIDAVLDRYR